MQVHRVHVVILERHPKDTANLERELTAHGYAVSTVTSPPALISAIAEQNPVVAVLDVLDKAVDEVVALHSLPDVSSSLAMILIARRDTQKSRTRLLEFQESEWAVVVRKPATLLQAIEERADRLQAARGLIRIGTTLLDGISLQLHTPSGVCGGSRAVCETLQYLMRARGRAVPEQELRTVVLRFAPDSQTNAVYQRITQLRKFLRLAGADIDVVRSAAGYHIMELTRPILSDAEREREKKKKNTEGQAI
jgi:DNA-binding response OmpR family regulator